MNTIVQKTILGIILYIACAGNAWAAVADYDPQAYNHIPNTPTQLAEKQAALNTLRSQYPEFLYSKEDVKRAFGRRGVSNASDVISHFNTSTGAWHNPIPTGSTLTNTEYETHQTFVSEVLALAYLHRYEGGNHTNLIYKALDWYFKNGYEAPHRYHYTFIYQDTKSTVSQQMVRIGQTIFDDIHADRVTKPIAERAYQGMREYARATIAAGPQIVGPNWALRMDECLAYIYFTNEPRDMDEYEYHWKKSLSFLQYQGEGTGIEADWSCKHHGDMNYWGMYGQSWTASAILYAELFKGKPWAYKKANYDFVANCMLEGVRWIMYRGVIEYTSAPKRGSVLLGRADGVVDDLKILLDRLIVVGGNKLTRKSELLDWQSDYFSPVFTPAGAAQADDPEYEGHRYFWATEYQAHRRSNFSIHTRRVSQRTRSPESRSEAPLHLNYGVGYTPIVRRGDEIRLSRVAWDFRHVPGTTVELGKDISGGYAGSKVRGLNLFSGGVTDGHYGFGGFEMNLVQYNNDNSGNYSYSNGAGALKGTFFFDDGMLALGQDINRIASVGAQEKVLTTINNVHRLTEVKYKVDGASVKTVATESGLEQSFTVSDVAWFHHDGMGYVIWPSANASTKLVASFGDRPFNSYLKNDGEFMARIKDELGQGVRDSEVLNMFRLWFDHGKNPSDDTYAYAVLPDCTVNQLKAYVANPTASIVKNTGGIQAVANAGEGVYYASFANSGTANFGGGKKIIADRPLMVMARNQGGSFDFTAANPQHVSLRREYVPGSGQTVGVLYNQPVEVGVPGFGVGANVEFLFNSDRGYEGGSVPAVTDTNVPVLGISISRSNLTLDEGETFDLNTTVSPADATNRDVTWSSSSDSVATVNGNGLVTALSAGSTTIKARTTDGGFETTCSLTVSSGSSSPLGWNLTQVGGGSGSGLTVDSANSDVVLAGVGNGSNGTSIAIMPFSQDENQGVVTTKLGVNSGGTWSQAFFSLVHVNGASIVELIQIRVQRNGDNGNNLIKTGSGNTSINGIWEDVLNYVEIGWNNGKADISVTWSDGRTVSVSSANYLNSGLQPNGLMIRVGTNNDTNSRQILLEDLAVSFSPVLALMADWEFDATGPGGVDSGDTGSDWTSITPETGDPAWIVTQTSGGAGSGLSVDTASSRLVLNAKGNGSNGVSEAVLAFDGDQPQGHLFTKMGVNSGGTWSSAKLRLVHVDGSGATSTLLEVSVQRDGDNNNNLIKTGSGNTSINGTWEDVLNSLEITWDSGIANVSVSGQSGTPVVVTSEDLLLPNLAPNALLLRVGANNDSKERKLELGELQVYFGSN